jgi:hypothetical protein
MSLQDNRQILVHYMHWNSRHDEWVASNSPRLRPVRSSSRLDSNGTSPTKTHVVSTDTTQLAKDFKTGDKVDFLLRHIFRLKFLLFFKKFLQENIRKSE